MIQAQTILAPDLAFLPRLLVTVLLIWLTGAVVGHMNKLIALTRNSLAHPRHRTGHGRTAIHRNVRPI
jgi:flagellar biosynthesis protein FliQ